MSPDPDAPAVSPAPSATSSFADLLAAAQQGSDRAVAELYRRHNPRLVRYLGARAGPDGEDLAAETWIAAARGLARFTGDEDGFAGWLFTIARRRLIDHRRARRRRPLRPMDHDVLEVAADPTGSAEGTAFDTTLADEEARRLASLLPPAQADVVLLRVVAGLDVDTVAAVIGRRPGTVRVIQHRGLRRLARLLDAEASTTGASVTGAPATEPSTTGASTTEPSTTEAPATEPSTTPSTADVRDADPDDPGSSRPGPAV